MAFTPVRDKTAISSKGGGVIRIKEVNSDGSDLTTTASVYDLGFLEETTYLDKTEEILKRDETAEVIDREEGNRDVIVQGTLMQNDKLTLDMAKETRGKYYAMLKQNGKTKGKQQEVFYGVGIIDPSFEVKFVGGTTPFKYTALKLASTVTIAATVASAGPTAGAGAWGAYTTATVTIAALDYYTIVETTA